ncbi:MAG: DUF3088 family protein [Parvularculaceae bacterium]|nr:DUF3088 family protein [Parvularculaceae bacterium]
MARDILFLLPPGFIDNGRREFCPECAEIWGFLHYFPAIKECLEISHEEIAHPRGGLVALLGEGRWNCPTLVLAPDAPHQDFSGLNRANGRAYLDSARAIARYYARRFGTPVPRGS